MTTTGRRLLARMRFFGGSVRGQGRQQSVLGHWLIGGERHDHWTQIRRRLFTDGIVVVVIVVEIDSFVMC